MSQKVEIVSRGKFVLIEDSMHIRSVLRMLLEANRFQVLEFENGQEAWDHLSETQHDDIWGLFVDIMMPEMDGLELTSKLREIPAYKEKPVIFITASPEKENILTARSLKAAAYLLKPLSATKVIEVLQKLFPGENFKELKMGA